MLSTAIVIFRETLEIAMILGVVLAATRGLSGRMRWIFGGFAGGVAGALLVAFFAEAISSFAEGMGQEFFNAIILFAAALVIGWTVIWMRTHARELTAQLRQVGKEVSEGTLPFYSLSLIIGLALLREGSEIALFVYGMVISGQDALSIMSGSAMGFAAGLTAGIMLYYGLLRLSAKYMLQVTSWLLILLVAGLASQGAGYLTAAGYFSNLSMPLWDSSWLISDDSIAGLTLRGLVGYSAQPSPIQLIFYALTLIIICSVIALTEKRKKVAVPL